MEPALCKAVWLDCDPGHDDAIAMLFALFAPSLRSSSKAQTNADTASAPAALNLLGCSVVAGNAPVSATMVNAARLLEFFGASLPSCPSDPEDSVHLFMGSEVPLVRSPRSDPDIHGEDGLGGVIGLPELSDPAVQRRIWASCDAHSSGNQGKFPMTSPGKLLAFWCSLLTHRIAKGLPKMTIIATGPLTNVALLLRAFPDLVNQGIEEIVIMGGTASGEKGNRGPLAEFNILVDPEAAAIVFGYDIPVVMAGLNVTHQAIFTPSLSRELTHRISDDPAMGSSSAVGPAFRATIASILTFFASTYASEFGFLDGPPVHDVLAVAYVVDPTIFYAVESGGSRGKGNTQRTQPTQPTQASQRTQQPRRYKVDVETSSCLALGATVVDYYAKEFDRPEEEFWGRGGRNVIVLEDLDVDRLWQLFFACVERAEAHKQSCSPT